LPLDTFECKWQRPQYDTPPIKIKIVKEKTLECVFGEQLHSYPLFGPLAMYITLANIYHINGSSIEIGDVASPHWQRGHRLQPISAAYWVSQMGTGRLWQQQQ